MIDLIIESIKLFFNDAEARDYHFVNEAELQHELGYWFRTRLPAFQIYFERPAKYFLNTNDRFTKKEIDLVVTTADKSKFYAIELKCPRSGRTPETMFEACRDIQFLEQLVNAGFHGGIFILHTNSVNFWQSKLTTGIYAPFRAGAEISGIVTKPTGRKDCEVHLSGNYFVEWTPYRQAERYWLQAIGKTS